MLAEGLVVTSTRQLLRGLIAHGLKAHKSISTDSQIAHLVSLYTFRCARGQTVLDEKKS